MLRLISIFILVTSCAHSHKESNTAPLHNTQAVLDLGRSAYLKGCVDGLKKINKQKESAFDKCKTMAVEYQKELFQILK